MSLSTPRAPDPYATAAAQQGANADSMRLAAQYNQINQVTPFGSQTYSGTIGDPNRTVTTSLSPEMQRLVNSQLGISQGLADQATTRLGQIPNTPFSLSGLTNVRQANPVSLTSSFDAGPALQTDFNSGGPLRTETGSQFGLTNQIADAGAIQRGIADQGPIQRGVSLDGLQNLPGQNDFGAERTRVEDALLARTAARLDPRMAQDKAALDSRLANQGITQGSQAYNDAIQNFEQSRNDAYSSAMNDAVLAGGNEQSRLFGLAMQGRQQGVGERFQQADFANQAQGQAFGQALQAGMFGNEAQKQAFSQNQAQAQFGNQTQAQDFQQQLQANQFYNAAQNQGYQQNMGQQQFRNQAAGQQFAQNQALADFLRQSQQGTFDQNQAIQASDMNLRNQGINERVMERNQGFNELAAFLGGSPQFQMPNFGTQAQYSPMGVPIGDYIQQNYQTRAQAGAAGLGAMGQLAGNAMMAYALCWVAREVFRDVRWLKMRKWMLRKAPESLFKFYKENGERIADFIKDKPLLRNEIRLSMEAIIGH